MYKDYLGTVENVETQHTQMDYYNEPNDYEPDAEYYEIEDDPENYVEYSKPNHDSYWDFYENEESQ